MLPPINNSYEFSEYTLLLTELEGIDHVRTGITFLTLTVRIKFNEYCTGRKEIFPYNIDEPASFCANCGKEALKLGLKKLAPVLGITLAYNIFKNYYQ